MSAKSKVKNTQCEYTQGESLGTRLSKSTTYISNVVSYLSLVVLVLLAVVQHAVTLPTQVPAVIAQDQRLRLPIIVVITQRLRERERERERERRKYMSTVSCKDVLLLPHIMCSSCQSQFALLPNTQTLSLGLPSCPSHCPEERASACSSSITHSAARHSHSYERGEGGGGGGEREGERGGERGGGGEEQKVEELFIIHTYMYVHVYAYIYTNVHRELTMGDFHTSIHMQIAQSCISMYVRMHTGSCGSSRIKTCTNLPSGRTCQDLARELPRRP